MTAADWAARHRRSILFLLAVLALGGFLSATTLPVALFPKVAFPRIQVVLDAGNRPAEQMLSEVMRPVEEAIRTVPGLRSIRSNTSRGSAELSVSFDWGSDMPQALLNVDAAITQSLSQLPPGVQFEAKRMDATVYPVAAYVLTACARTWRSLILGRSCTEPTPRDARVALACSRRSSAAPGVANNPRSAATNPRRYESS